MWQQLLEQLQKGDTRSLARTISLVENEQAGFEALLESLPPDSHTRIIGITGPPGAGKSTLVNGLIATMVADEKRVAVLCVDPSSPFNLGAVLGDRIRMSEWYLHPGVFIRSLATRGSLGGLHPRILEITDVVKAAPFDYIIVETVGVGQSEIEIAGLADATVVVLVPEAGDEVQTMKAGLMEIADIFVVNKSDRPDADLFVKGLRQMLAPAFHQHKREVPVVKTVASQHQGIEQLYTALQEIGTSEMAMGKRNWLLTQKAWLLIQKHRMRDLNRLQIQQAIEERDPSSFNIYRFARRFY